MSTNKDHAWETFWEDHKLETFKDWAMEHDRDQLREAFVDFCLEFTKLVNEIMPAPNTYWDLPDSRKLVFINWIESTGNYGFNEWLEAEFQLYLESLEAEE